MLQSGPEIHLELNRQKERFIKVLSQIVFFFLILINWLFFQRKTFICYMLYTNMLYTNIFIYKYIQIFIYKYVIYIYNSICIYMNFI